MYKPIRIALKSLLREFRRASTIYPSLFHEQYFFWDQLSLPREAWDAFIQINMEGDKSVWERFDASGNLGSCGRFFGNELGLEEFKRLGESLYQVLCELDPSLDREEGYLGVLNVLYRMSEYPTPLLWYKMSAWKEGEFKCPPYIGEDGGEPFPKQLGCLGLVNNVFTSAMGAIQNVLNPGNALLIGEMIDELPLGLCHEPSALQQGSDGAAQDSSEVRNTKTSAMVEKPSFRFVLMVDFWDVQYREEKGHFENLEGFRHIAKLLASQDKAIEAIQLQGFGDSPVANEILTPQFALGTESEKIGRDAIAKREQEIAQAKEAGDQTRVADLQNECNVINKFLEKDEFRRLGEPSSREKARKAVVNTIARAKKKIRKPMPEFAKFLDQSILANETSWTYTPLPPAPEWEL
jgi:hypothetical protein